MELTDDIRMLFATSDKGKAYLINSLPDEYPAYVFRDSESFGVVIPYEGGKVYEEFANVMLYSEERMIGARQGNWLCLASTMEETRNTFATICADFILPGKNGASRKELVHYPSSWWNNWKRTIGNRNSNKEPHSIIGELLVFKYLLKKGIRCQWTGAGFKVHDLVTDSCDFEVKSSLKRYGRVITVNGEYQLIADEGKELKVVFVRLQENMTGYSINDMVRQLEDIGISADVLNRELSQLGYHVGGSIRNKKYCVLEAMTFDVNENFPRIIPSSFKEDRFPTGTGHISYESDLSICTGLAIDLTQ